MTLPADIEGFFVPGGTLKPDALCYVERRADQELFRGLKRGEFCYVLDSRQMGKSSLMNRTAARLGEDGVTVVMLDLTSVGRNVSVEQWYYGLLSSVGQQLGLREELREFWLSHQLLGPAQRWIAALREVVLPGIQVFGYSGIQEAGFTPADPIAPTSEPPSAPNPEYPNTRIPEYPPLVIFVDEIDAVRNLLFSTDEFFAAIRECYNRRAHDPELNRLTFCLLGVATPSDLIADTRTTPFNIGRRIELADFTPEEAVPLRVGLQLGEPGDLGRSEAQAQALLERVFFWTGGHPYLTQRLCQAVSSDAGARLSADVDRLCASLFLEPGSDARDDNLLFVRERLLRGEADVTVLLTLYAGVRRSRRFAGRIFGAVRNDPANPLVSILQLSGIVRVSPGGYLAVRNRVYGRVFDAAWIDSQLPDAEARRQRAAYRQGLLRAGGTAGVVIAALGYLALTAHWSAVDAHRAERKAQRFAEDRRLALADARRLLYVARMQQVEDAVRRGDFARASDLLEKDRPAPGEEDLRGWEWRYFWHLCHRDLATFPGHDAPVTMIRYLLGGKVIAAGTSTRTLTLRNVASGASLGTYEWRIDGESYGTTLSADGQVMAAIRAVRRPHRADGSEWEIRVRNVAANREDVIALGNAEVERLALSPDGSALAGLVRAPESGAREVRLWSSPSHTESRLRFPASCLDFASGRLVIGGEDGVIRIWDTAAGRIVSQWRGGQAKVKALVCSADGELVAAALGDGTIAAWNLQTRSSPSVFPLAGGDLMCLAVSPDHTILAAATRPPRRLDVPGEVRFWDTRTGMERLRIRGHNGPIMGLALSPDGNTAVTGGWDRSVKVWNIRRERGRDIPRAHRSAANSLEYSPHGDLLASRGMDGEVILWDASSMRVLARSSRNTPGYPLVFSPDGQALAFNSGTDAAVWQVPGRSEPARYAQPAEVKCVSFLPPAGEVLAASEADGAVRLLDRRSGRLISTFQSGVGIAAAVAASPDGRILATAGSDGWVRLWDAVNLRQLPFPFGIPGATRPMRFSHDGRLLAVGTGKGLALLEPAGHRVWFLGESTSGVRAISFSSDDRTMATAGQDRLVRLWNVTTKQQVCSLDEFPVTVRSLSFSADGLALAAGGLDGRIRVWRVPSRTEADLSGSLSTTAIPFQEQAGHVGITPPVR